MGNLFFNEYPYTDFHELNLSWVIRKILALDTKLTQFVSLNTIKYADPLEWDITKQYETNTVVMDQNTGTAYLSTQPVPAGVNLANTDYWTVIFDLAQLIGNINENLTVHNAGMSATATFDSATGDWILWNGGLYEALSDIYIGYAYVPDANIKKKSVEELVKQYRDALYIYIGLLSDLTTSDKTSIVNAINSVLSDLNTVIGSLTDLTTSDRTSIVNAINSVLSDLNTVIGNLANLTTTDKTSVVNAINEIVANIGNLASLTTTNKSSIVAAINEVDSHADATQAQLTSLNNYFIEEVQKRRVLVNVLDFGADPTGLEDSSQAFIDAFNYIPSTAEYSPGGDAIYVPAGVYILNSEIDMTSKAVEVFGDGPNATRIIGWGSADPDSGYPTYFRVKRANIHDLRFEGDNRNCVCIRFVGGHNDNWTNNVFNCMFWWCLKGVEYTGSSLRYSHNDCVNSSTCITFYGSGVNSIITDSYFGLYTEGINSAGGTGLEGVTITDNYFVGGNASTNAICFYGDALSVIIDGNMFDQLYGDAGVKFAGGCNDIKILNSWFGSNYVDKDCSRAIWAASVCNYMRIYNCQFVDMKYNDIFIQGTSKDLVIDSCFDYVTGSENLGPINGSCIVTTGVTTRARILNCTLTPRTGTAFGVSTAAGSTGLISGCSASYSTSLTVVNPL